MLAGEKYETFNDVFGDQDSYHFEIMKVEIREKETACESKVRNLTHGDFSKGVGSLIL